MMQTQRAERVDYAASIQLLAMERGDPIAGYTANLSESGMFVTVPCPFEVGTRVVCELPIPGDRLQLQGEVRWVQEVAGDDACSPMMGIGIQFVGLSAGAASALRKLVTERRGALQMVAVQFEGYGRPIRARAQLTPQGLQLWTALPFLRLNSPVNVAFDREVEAARAGVLDQVLLSVEQGVPRLKIDVSLAVPSSGEAAEPPGNEALLTPVSGSIERSSAPGVSRTISEEIAAPLVSVIDGPSGPDGGLSEVVDTAEAEPAWADEALGAPHPGPLDPGATVRVEPPPYEQFWRGAERRRRWVWAAAIAMAAAAIASLARPQLWSGVADALWPARSVAASAQETAAQIADQATVAQGELATASSVAQTPQPPPQPAPAAKAAATAAPPQPAPAAKAAATAAPPQPAPAAKTAAQPVAGKPKEPLAVKMGQLTLSRGAAGVTLEVPIGGSIAGESHYVLAAPEGVAVNLPEGTPGMALGHYTLDRDGLKAVWIREREGGIQVRVFFPASRVPHEVRVERGRIRLTLSE